MGNGLSPVNLLLKIKPEGNEAETGIKTGVKPQHSTFFC